jgi:apolipoprotein N-acyltransferase
MSDTMPQWLTPLWRQCALALIVGAFMTLSYAPYQVSYLPYFLIPVWLYLVLRSAAPFKVGLAFGLGWFGAGISWVHVSIADYGGVPLAVSLLMMLVLCAYLALYPALFAYLLAKVNRHSAQQLLPVLCAAPVLWYVTEWARGWVLTGFPWLSLGYSQVNGIAHSMLPVIGESGVAALMILIAMSLTPPTQRLLGRYEIEAKSNGLFATGFVMVILLNYLPHTWGEVQQDEQITVAMVQGNIPQSLRWVPEEDANTMRKYLTMTQELWASHDVIIWPEAAIPQLEPLALSYLSELNTLAEQHDSALVTGVLNYRVDTDEAFNNVIVIDGNYQYEHANRYAKHHLLPIGEFVPFESVLRGLAPIFDLPMSSFTRGDYLQPNLIANGLTMTTALCYEILFARQVRANLSDNTNAILTLSNDAWFGDSHGPHQHMQIAQTRAAELGIPVLRSTNNGVTGIVAADGSNLAQIPSFSATHLSYALPARAFSTPYKTWGEWINMWWLSCVGVFGLYWARQWRFR